MKRVVAVSVHKRGHVPHRLRRRWGCVYHGGEWIEEPHRLDVLLADDVPRFESHGPWSTRFAVLQSEVLKRAERALRDAEPAVRAKFKSLGLS